MIELRKDIDIDFIIRKKQFHHVYQPVYDLRSWEIYGVEVLIRCEFFDSAELLFQVAAKEQKLYELDTCSIHYALAIYKEYAEKQNTKWFLNVFPSTLVHPCFQNFLAQISGIPHRADHLIFEMNEAEQITDMAALKEAVAALKARPGFAIAIDDFGNGDASIRNLVELQPKYVKLDRFFSANLSASAAKQNMVKMLVEFCRENNMHLILEGIETPKDLAAAKRLGVRLGQGFLLGKPFPFEMVLQIT